MRIPLPTKTHFRVAALFVVLFGVAPTEVAHAGGFYLFDRGVVGVSRGGAFVAGADDADALHYNPAGLLNAGQQLQVDIALPRINASFQRNDPAAGGPMARVDASQAPLPTPTIAYARNMGRWAVGGGVFTPSAVVLEWPTTVGTQAAPQRFSLYSMDGTILATVMAGAAYDIGHGFSVGASVGVNIARFNIDTAISGCDGLLCSDPYDPDYDSYVNLDSGLRFAPHATLGVRYAHEHFAVGASFTTPHSFRGDLDMDASVPPALVPGGAYYETGDGNSPRVRGDLRFPWIARLGVEVRPVRNLRTELAYVVEGWNVQKELRFAPQDVRIVVIPGALEPELIPIVVRREMRATHSIRAGAQYTVSHFDFRAGLAYETRSFPDRTLSPLTLDNNKTILSAGATAHLGDHVMLDLTFAYAFMRDPNITNSVVEQPIAINQLVAYDPPIIANGKYEMDAWYIGAGLRWQITANERVASR